MTTALIIIILLFINAFFVAAEFALVKARSTRIDTMAISGKLGASATQKILSNLEPHLAACQLGITMASLGLGWVGEPFVAMLLEPLLHSLGLSDAAIHTTAFVAGFLIFSSLHITVGEQVPKTLAIRKAEKVSLWTAYPLRTFFLVFYPLNATLNVISRSILRLFGVQEAPHAEIYSSEEIETIVSTSTEHGELSQDKGDMLNNMFRFDQLRVSRIMIPFSRVRCLDLSKSEEENKTVLISTGHSRFPLIDSKKSGNLQGIVLVKDLFNASLEGKQSALTELEKYARKTLVISEHQNVASLFDQMRIDRSHFAIVVDEYGEMVGIVTIEDLLEEIVGEIEDETDIDDTRNLLTKTGNGRWLVDGLISLVDIEKQIDIEFDPKIDANTLSGFMMERLSRMPKIGDEIYEGGFTFSVKKVTNRYAESIEVQATNTLPPSGS